MQTDSFETAWPSKLELTSSRLQNGAALVMFPEPAENEWHQHSTYKTATIQFSTGLQVNRFSLPRIRLVLTQVIILKDFVFYNFDNIADFKVSKNELSYTSKVGGCLEVEKSKTAIIRCIVQNEFFFLNSICTKVYKQVRQCVEKISAHLTT